MGHDTTTFSQFSATMPCTTLTVSAVSRLFAATRQFFKSCNRALKLTCFSLRTCVTQAT